MAAGHARAAGIAVTLGYSHITSGRALAVMTANYAAAVGLVGLLEAQQEPTPAFHLSGPMVLLPAGMLLEAPAPC